MKKLKKYRIDIAVKNWTHVRAKSKKEAIMKGAETLKNYVELDGGDLRATEIKEN